MRYLFLLFSLSLWSQQTKKVDFIKLNATVEPNFYNRSVSGSCNYQFKVLHPIDSIKIDAIKMDFEAVQINGKNVRFKNSGKSLILFEGYKKGMNSLQFTYTAKPKQTLYFVEQKSSKWDGLSSANQTDVQYKDYQIWTQGQGKYTSHWLPSFDDVNEKVIFNISVSAEPFFEVIANGTLKKVSHPAIKAHKTWHYEMQKPMSSYLVMLAIGLYQSKTLYSNNGVPLHLYYKYDDADKFNYAYNYSNEIFNFLEKETGVKYPWGVYKQVPVEDFLYAGMENTTATLFSQDYMVDKIGFNDRNYINVNAHELAHHWFGDLVTAKEGKHHWLQEGFATYYALLAEKHLFGDDHFQYELLQYAEEIQEASKQDTIPIMNEKASVLSFYKKGAWALHFISETIGQVAFQKAVKNYLKKFKFKNVETADFLKEINKVAPKFDTQAFQKNWLESKSFDSQTIMGLLSKNKTMQQYFELQSMENVSFEQKKELFTRLLKSDYYYILSQEIVYQLAKVPFEEKKELLALAMQSNDIRIRQAIALTTKTIPFEFKSVYETLLLDESYATKEVVLVQLCKQFPEDQNRYLDMTKQWIGNNDKSFRTVWLGMALKAKDYQPDNQATFYEELLDYASLGYSGSVRQNALEVLLKINPSDARVLSNLVNATLHHKWQFVRFAKNTIRNMLKKENFKKDFEALLPKLSEREQNFLKAELK